MEELEECFLTKGALHNLFVYMCKSNAESHDPITDALVTMLTGVVHFTISKHGLLLLKGAPALPFTHMNPEQRQLLYNVVNSLRCEVPTFSAFALTENPLTYTVENERITLNTPSYKIDHKLIFTILLECIAESKRPSLLLFNLIVQRIGCRVNVSRDTIAFAHTKSKSLLV